MTAALSADEQADWTCALSHVLFVLNQPGEIGNDLLQDLADLSDVIAEQLEEAVRRLREANHPWVDIAEILCMSEEQAMLRFEIETSRTERDSADRQ